LVQCTDTVHFHLNSVTGRQQCRCIVPKAVYTVKGSPEDGRICRPKHVGLIKETNKRNLLHLVGCLHCYSSDARSHKHQKPFTKYFHANGCKFSRLTKLSTKQNLTSAFHRNFEIKRSILVTVNKRLLHYVRDIGHPTREPPCTLPQCHHHDHQTCSDKERTHEVLGRQWQYLYTFKVLSRVYDPQSPQTFVLTPFPIYVA
jgi:hypothetical protein